VSACALASKHSRPAIAARNRCPRSSVVGRALANSSALLNRESLMLWLLVLILVILAIAGGVALSKFLWLVLIVALIVALVAMLSGRRTA
jgi:hypothetical protein